jgi:hypothetical protein
MTSITYNIPISFVVILLSVFLVPAAILWGIAKSELFSFKLNQTLKSLSLGLSGTALLIGLTIFLTEASWFVRYGPVYIPTVSVFSTIMFTLVSHIVLKRRYT